MAGKCLISPKVEARLSMFIIEWKWTVDFNQQAALVCEQRCPSPFRRWGHFHLCCRRISGNSVVQMSEWAKVDYFPCWICAQAARVLQLSLTLTTVRVTRLRTRHLCHTCRQNWDGGEKKQNSTLLHSTALTYSCFTKYLGLAGWSCQPDLGLELTDESDWF